MNKCKHCGDEYNYILPAGYCNGCLNYLKLKADKKNKDLKHQTLIK